MAEGAAPLDIAQLVAEHHPLVYRYAFRLAGSTADAEDLTQQVFLIAQQKLSQLRDAQCARSWLCTVLRNCYLKSRRQRVPLPAASADLDVDQIPDDAVEHEVDSERLQAALDALDDDFKITVLLFYFEHRSYREIAEALEIPIGTVMSRLARAKARLRRELTRPQEAATPHSDLKPLKRPGYPALGRPAAGTR
jgi:RNA polymerase sigma-70 factor (ECF subfamily)